MTSEEKTIKSLMARLNIVERENITLKKQNESLKSIVNNDILIISRLRDGNKRLAAIISGESIQNQIDILIKSVGGC